MKEIKAFIKPFMLAKVEAALLGTPGFVGMTVTDCRGIGHDQLQRKLEKRGLQVELVKKVKIEMVVPDHLVDTMANVILHAAHTSNPGDGIIYISNVEDAVRIKTFDKGEPAF